MAAPSRTTVQIVPANPTPEAHAIVTDATRHDRRPDDAPLASTLPRRPRRHPGRWLVSAILLLLLTAVAAQVATTRTIHFSVIPVYLVDPLILQGVEVTVLLTLVCLVIGVVIGLVLAIARLSNNAVARAMSVCYLWVFLSTPGLVQLIFWYNLAIVFPRIVVGIPYVVTFWSGSTNTVITAMTAAMLGLGLHEAAYYCEIIRSGILSVGRGQTEAAQSLGIRSARVMRRIILPQAVRVMLPPGMTRVIALMKDTSLVTVIAGGELMTNAQIIYTQNFMVIELLSVVCVWYMALVSLLMFAQRRLERWASRYQGGATGSVKAAMLQWG